jgi:hypothetical protein
MVGCLAGGLEAPRGETVIAYSRRGETACCRAAAEWPAPCALTNDDRTGDLPAAGPCVWEKNDRSLREGT